MPAIESVTDVEAQHALECKLAAWSEDSGQGVPPNCAEYFGPKHTFVEASAHNVSLWSAQGKALQEYLAGSHDMDSLKPTDDHAMQKYAHLLSVGGGTVEGRKVEAGDP